MPLARASPMPRSPCAGSRRAHGYRPRMPAPLALFAACQPGLEPFLVGELKALGAEPQAQRGGVAFQGDQALLLRCGLWLGTASHLLVRLGSFRCRALG